MSNVAPFQSYGEMASRRLTGQTRWRRGWFGRSVLQVEVLSPMPCYPRAPSPPWVPYDPWRYGSYTFWRDATPDDKLKAHRPRKAKRGE
jgi:hypothetical protein